MKSLRFLDRRATFSIGAIGLLLGMILPAAFPVFASAGVVASRSMQLSSSAAGATNVSYQLTFTPATTEATGYVVVFFCNDSPIPGQTCTAPSGFTAASATSSPAGVVAATDSLKIAQAMTASTPVTITFSGITNPSAATTSSTGFYARIQTFANSTDATAAVTAGAGNAGDTTNMVDEGGIAMAITNAIGVSAAVRESMTFCVSHSAPTVNCGGTDSPSITLGHGSPQALDSSATDTASDYSQISTNAVGGAVVSLKNSNNCGGLQRTGASGCDIAAAAGGDAINPGTAMFGLLLGTPTTLSGGSGAVNAAADFAGPTNYGMTYSGSTGSGVSSTYGAPLYNTGTAPINNVNVPMTFAASASNTTPAGLYQATLNLIATGTF